MEIGVPGGFLAWLTASLDHVADVVRSHHLALDDPNSVEPMLASAFPAVEHLFESEAALFLTVLEDGVGFTPRSCSPATSQEDMEREVDALVESGTFAWALYRNAPAIVRGREPDTWVLLHSLATPTRVLGMFVARLDQQTAFVPDVAQKLLTLLLANVASAIEGTQHRNTLQKATKDLEKKVEARTVALRRSEQLARNASGTQEELLRRIGHDLRGPLNGVLGMADLLLSSDLTQDQVLQVETIQRSGARLLKIFDEIFDFREAEKGALELETTDVNLKTLVRGVVEAHWDLGAKKGVPLLFRFQKDLPEWVRADPKRLRQVLQHLVNNAVRFTQEGHVFVEVTQGDGGDIRFSVSDTGPGVKPEDAERIFDEFVKVPGVPAVPTGGPGLGLPLCRELTALMGGVITVQPKARGAEFAVHVPLIPVPPPPDDRDLPPTLAGQEVVVVGRDHLPRGIVSEKVADLGGKPDVYSSIEEAMDPSHGPRNDPFLLLIGDVGQNEVPWAEGPWTRAVLVGPSDSPGAGDFDAVLSELVTDERLAAALGVGLDRIEPKERPSSTDARTPKVLIVEDDEVNARVGRLMLGKLGLDVEIAASGGDAVSRLTGKDAESIDLVLMDCFMPGMDGLEATGAVRAWERTRGSHVPIVGLSAGKEDHEGPRCLRAGMDAFLPKPVHIDTLEAIVRHWIPSADRNQERPPPAEAKTEDLDWDHVSDRFEEDLDAVSEVFAVFNNTWPDLHQQMRRGIASKDLEVLALLAHRLRGAAGNLGAAVLARSAGEMEEAARAGDASNCERLFLVIEEDVGRFQAAVAGALQEVGP